MSTIKEPSPEDRLRGNFEKNYSSVVRFSKVIGRIMDLLKDLETKRDEMGKKIEMQDSHMDSMKKEPSAK